MTCKKVLGICLIALVVSGCGILEVFEEPERGEYTAEDYYRDAKELLEDGDYSGALAIYQDLESNFPFGNYTEQAQLETIYAHYKSDNPEAALAAADRFIRLHPTHENVAYAYYLKGLVNQPTKDGVLATLARGDSSPDRDPRAAREAHAAFAEVVRRFPDSRYAADARRRMDFLDNALAMHEIYVADYYMRRSAYVAVVNRGKHVLNAYPASAATEHALGLMMLAYTELGMNDLAGDSQRVLKLNFPDSVYLSGRRPRITEQFGLFPDLDLNPFD